MKNITYTNLLVFLTFFISSCRKPNNIYLAKNYFEQSLVENEERNSSQAMQLVNKSIEIFPTPRALAFKAELFQQNQEFQQSIDLYAQLLKDKKTPNNIKADAINNMACAYLDLGQKENAKKMWLNLTTNSNYSSPELAWYNLGLLEMSILDSKEKNEKQQQEALKSAAKYLGKAISISNEFIDAYYYLALTYICLKEYNKAKEIVVTLLSITPDHEAAQELLDLANKGMYNKLADKREESGY